VLFYNRVSEEEEESDDALVPTKGRGRMPPLIRRQSVSRPDLWPHMQVQDHQFRGFARHSVKVHHHPLPMAPLLTQDEEGKMSPEEVAGSESIEAELEHADSKYSV
jgi:hypothetical protein